jgi:protein-S-isoprenylcysteine O-methyltransferase Ste14
MFSIVAVCIRIIWLVIEVPYVRRFRVGQKQPWDKYSALFWDLASGIEATGLVLAYFGFGLLHISDPVKVLGLSGLLIGIAIRWTAIYQLGRFFNSIVTIHDDHRLNDRGLYRIVRHPAYTGTLIAHFGLGLSFGSWISLTLSNVPFLFAAWYRIRVEEHALSVSFGEEYLAYRKRTARLIPRVY